MFRNRQKKQSEYISHGTDAQAACTSSSGLVSNNRTTSTRTQTKLRTHTHTQSHRQACAPLYTRNIFRHGDTVMTKVYLLFRKANPSKSPYLTLSTVLSWMDQVDSDGSALP